MVDNLDSNVGRVLGLLEELGESDNTLVVFLSENGADPYDRNTRPIYAVYQEQGYDNGLANMGAGNSYIFYGLGWAQVGSVHHRHYKFLTSEGGMHAPMIARFPGVLVPGDDRDAFATALDVAPTFLELAGVEPPRTAYQGREIHPMRGRSLVPYMKDSRNVPYADDEPVAFEIFGHGVVFMGPWKAVRLRPP
jgi:arylsulfatase